MTFSLKTPSELAIMREAGRVVALAHNAMRDAIKPGISTWELDQIAAAILREHDAKPAFLGHTKPNSPPYPATITASINEELVHGIPKKDRILQEGDIISLDVGCFYQGFVGDAARTWCVGQVSARAKKLVDIGYETLMAAIEAARPGKYVSDVARATQAYAKKHGYSVALEYTGHGVGREMWEQPAVPNWWPRKLDRRWQSEDRLLEPGMTIAIEPMIIAGRPKLKELDDKWTVVTKDRSLCVHWEHSIAITDSEPLILTLP
jgi:methionyl aminopeptidase